MACCSPSNPSMTLATTLSRSCFDPCTGFVMRLSLGWLHTGVPMNVSANLNLCFAQLGETISARAFLASSAIKWTTPPTNVGHKMQAPLSSSHGVQPSFPIISATQHVFAIVTHMHAQRVCGYGDLTSTLQLT